MSGFDLFIAQYGLIAIFLLLFIKAIGVPIPIPADLIMLTTAVGVAQGRFIGWLAFVAILFALVLGGVIQYILARGPGRGLLYRFGRYIGLTTARLDAASTRIQKGGVPGLSIAIVVPGVRSAAVAAAGLANLPLRTFLIGLIIGSILFLTLHFLLGFAGGTLLTAIGHVLPASQVLLVVVVLILIAFALWVVAFRRQKVARKELDAASLEVWHEGICPVCLALYTANQLRTPFMAERE